MPTRTHMVLSTSDDDDDPNPNDEFWLVHDQSSLHSEEAHTISPKSSPTTIHIDLSEFVVNKSTDTTSIQNDTVPSETIATVSNEMIAVESNIISATPATIAPPATAATATTAATAAPTAPTATTATTAPTSTAESTTNDTVESIRQLESITEQTNATICTQTNHTTDTNTNPTVYRTFMNESNSIYHALDDSSHIDHVLDELLMIRAPEASPTAKLPSHSTVSQIDQSYHFRNEFSQKVKSIPELPQKVNSTLVQQISNVSPLFETRSLKRNTEDTVEYSLNQRQKQARVPVTPRRTNRPKRFHPSQTNPIDRKVSRNPSTSRRAHSAIGRMPLGRKSNSATHDIETEIKQQLDEIKLQQNGDFSRSSRARSQIRRDEGAGKGLSVRHRHLEAYLSRALISIRNANRLRQVMDQDRISTVTPRSLSTVRASSQGSWGIQKKARSTSIQRMRHNQISSAHIPSRFSHTRSSTGRPRSLSFGNESITDNDDATYTAKHVKKLLQLGKPLPAAAIAHADAVYEIYATPPSRAELYPLSDRSNQSRHFFDQESCDLPIRANLKATFCQVKASPPTKQAGSQHTPEIHGTKNSSIEDAISIPLNIQETSMQNKNQNSDISIPKEGTKFSDTTAQVTSSCVTVTNTEQSNLSNCTQDISMPILHKHQTMTTVFQPDSRITASGSISNTSARPVVDFVPNAVYAARKLFHVPSESTACSQKIDGISDQMTESYSETSTLEISSTKPDISLSCATVTTQSDQKDQIYLSAIEHNSIIDNANKEYHTDKKTNTLATDNMSNSVNVNRNHPPSCWGAVKTWLSPRRTQRK